jgi:uncharacterized protein YjbI with pentapeptide repeats
MEQLNKIVRTAASVVEGGLNAVGAWCGRHRITAISIGGLSFLFAWSWFVGGWWLLSEGPRQALTAYNNIPDKDKVEAFGKLATALGLLVAAPFALLGVGLAFWRTWNQHRDSELAARKLEIESLAKQADSELAARKLDAEAFAKAVEQLGHAEIAIRMGAVLALQNLAEASPRRLLGQTLEIFCAYVREKRPRTEEADAQAAVPLPTDIKLTLQVISRLNRRNTDGKIPVDLSSTDLRGADLSEAHLRKIKLINSNLTLASFWEANLQESLLWNSEMGGGVLGNANLQDAELGMANLQNAFLGKANLQGTDLKQANLQGAFLVGANMEGANLSGANLQGANLKGTILEKNAGAGG